MKRNILSKETVKIGTPIRRDTVGWWQWRVSASPKLTTNWLLRLLLLLLPLRPLQTLRRSRLRRWRRRKRKGLAIGRRRGGRQPLRIMTHSSAACLFCYTNSRQLWLCSTFWLLYFSIKGLVDDNSTIIMLIQFILRSFVWICFALLFFLTSIYSAMWFSDRCSHFWFFCFIISLMIL